LGGSLTRLPVKSARALALARRQVAFEQKRWLRSATREMQNGA
jgi:hypothetical protein